MITECTTIQPDFPVLLPDGCDCRDVLFFDIETTGFAADVTALYLIGCICYDNGSWKLIQWFADDNKSEAELLTAFFQKLSAYKLLIHFNGTGFDIPYLLKKCSKYQFSFDFSGIAGLDLYKELLPCKQLFRVPNLKQKTVEEFLGHKRRDTLSGGDMIPYYSAYLKAKYGHKPEEAETLYHMLTQHNKEDLTGMLAVSGMLAYSRIPESELSLTDCTLDRQKNEFLLSFKLPMSLPKRVSTGNSECYFTAFQESAQFRIALYRGELKYFYSNYKDYYYLPQEDTAIHKSVAFYVDKNYRTRARAANCYSRHSGYFLPQYAEVISPYFKIDYMDKVTYLEATPEFCADSKELARYARHLLKHLLAR